MASEKEGTRARGEAEKEEITLLLIADILAPASSRVSTTKKKFFCEAM